MTKCWRCGYHPGNQPGGLCFRCNWWVMAEAARGIARLEAYLRAWASFDRWLDDHRAA